jgi:hypothetical protein
MEVRLSYSLLEDFEQREIRLRMRKFEHNDEIGAASEYFRAST